jgi:hypothetical protein
MNAKELIELLGRFRFTAPSEAELQRSVENVLVGARVAFEREAILTPQERIDFLIEGGVGLELKIGGSVIAIARQVQRYCRIEKVSEVVLASTRLAHVRGLADLTSFNGKAVHAVRLHGALL